MSAIRAKDTSPELALRRVLWARGVRGYRLHPRAVAGRPDLAFTRARVAVFVHGCFWHACPECSLPEPRANSAFWCAKFDRNRARDARKEMDLARAGWSVVTIWEHEVKASPEGCADRVERALRRAQARR